MPSFEDIVDDAKQFLQGKMSQQDAIAFIRLLERNPHLRKEFEIMEKMVSVMREIPEHELKDRLEKNHEYTLSEKKRSFNSKTILYVFLTIVTLGLLLVLFWKREAVLLDPSVDKKGVKTFAGAEKMGLFANTANGLALGPDGSLYIAGNFHKEIDFGSNQLFGDSNSLDFFLAKLSPELSIEWAQAYGGNGDDYVDKIAVDNYSNLIIVGRITDTLYLDGKVLIPRRSHQGDRGHDLFIAKMNEEEEIIWAMNDGHENTPYVSSGSGTIDEVKIDERNNIYAVGSMHATSIWDHPIPQTKSGNAFIVKIDPGGQIQWLETLVGEYGVHLFDLDIQQDKVAVCGSFGHQNLGGDIVLNDSIIPSAGGKDIVVTTYDTNGIFQWARTAGSPNLGLGDISLSIKYSNDFSLKVTGSFEGLADFGAKKINATIGRDFFLASYQPAGDLEWIVQGGGGTSESKNTDLDEGSVLAIDAQGNTYVGGIFATNAGFSGDTLHPHGIQDLFVAKYSRLGELIWIRPFGGDSDMVNLERTMDMVINDQGDCFITGFFSGDLFIEELQLQSSGHLNIFILALDSSGRVKQFQQLFATAGSSNNDPI